MGDAEIKVKYMFIWLLFLGVSNLEAQGAFTPEKTLITTIPIGKSNGQAFFRIDEDGYYSPGSPEIDDTAAIWLFSHTNPFILKIEKNRIHTIAYPNDYPESYRFGPNGFPVISQNGYYGFSSHNSSIESVISSSVNIRFDSRSTYYFVMPWGLAIQYSGFQKEVQIGSIEYKPMKFSMSNSVSRNYFPRTVDDTKKWIVTQPGGFSIGEDGKLYRNGILWSAIKPAVVGGNYAGRLASGHLIWDTGSRIVISNSNQDVELEMEIPWAKEDCTNGGFENHGIGPWGEIYYLIPPPLIPTGKIRSDHGGGFYKVRDFDETKPAELVVVRNHLKYFGRLNDGGVRLRKEPSTSGEILGTYPNKTGFRILEKGTKEETIGGKKNVWYKVRLLDGKEGCFFGSFVHNLYDGPNGTPPPWPNVPDW